MDAIPGSPGGEKRDSGPAALSWLFTLAIGASLWFILRSQGNNLGWPWVLATLPPLMVAQHAFFLHSVKSRSVSPQKGAGKSAILTVDFEALEGAWRRYFAPGQILLRFGVPALFLACACVLQAGLFFGGWFPRLSPSETIGHQLLAAGRFGLAGAYAYVMVHLGIRNFRADLTGGGAMWCAVTVILGPGIAIVAALALPLKENEQFARAALFFLAGLSPQKVIGYISDSARKALGDGALSAAVLNNKSLLCIRGITLDIQDRLREEGIEDAYALAFAEPYHLLRNTNFSPRQILAWMDESLLYFFLPDTAEWLIRQHGLTGAIDLAYLGHLATIAPAGPAAKVLDTLCTKVGMPLEEFHLLLQRMFEDQQLIQVWNLYNSMDVWQPKAFEMEG